MDPSLFVILLQFLFQMSLILSILWHMLFVKYTKWPTCGRDLSELRHAHLLEISLSLSLTHTQT